MINEKELQRIREEGWGYECCSGDPKCANNRTKKFINELFALVHTDLNAARDMLFGCIEELEMDRDWNKALVEELRKELKCLKSGESGHD